MLPILIAVWQNIEFVDCFGISSFGKANTETPPPPTTTMSPGKTYLYRLIDMPTISLIKTTYAFHMRHKTQCMIYIIISSRKLPYFVPSTIN